MVMSRAPCERGEFELTSPQRRDADPRWPASSAFCPWRWTPARWPDRAQLHAVEVAHRGFLVGEEPFDAFVVHRVRLVLHAVDVHHELDVLVRLIAGRAGSAPRAARSLPSLSGRASSLQVSSGFSMEELDVLGARQDEVRHVVRLARPVDVVPGRSA